MPEVTPVASVSVNVLVPLPGATMVVGEKPDVTPLGRPLSESVIAELNPLTAAVVSVILAGVPTATFAPEALGVNEKVEALVSSQ